MRETALVLRRTIAATCLVGSLGASATESVRDPSSCPGECERPIGYAVDPRFTVDERAIIVEAMGVWERGTSGRVCFAPEGRDLVIDKLDRSDELQPWDSDWPQHVALTKGGRIWIVASRIGDPGEYRALVVHELGHYLGIGHIEDTPRTYMHSTINDTPGELWAHTRLPPRDARAFCDVHRCVCSN